jgi:NhaP-type Na+/H+ or K+/H+ antiporter
MTTDQIYLGVSLIITLAVGCQIIGSLLRIPALILLLPAGFIAGALTDDVNPDKLLGSTFQPLVSLSVAVILYDAGLGLRLANLTGHTRKVVLRLIILGVPITWLVATILSEPLFGMAHGTAVMLGAILVVSGPTVVGPLLGFVNPTQRLRRVLNWEGSLIDPIGGLIGAVVFHGVSASQQPHAPHQLAAFFASLGTGALGGLVGTAILWFLLYRVGLGDILGTLVQLAAVVAIAGVCDVIREDSGLIAAVSMGLAVANLRWFDMPSRQPFFEVLVQLIIGLLFISISATVTPASARSVLLPTLALVAALVLVVRPIVAAVSCWRTDVPRNERAFIGWMAPRGIVAAATASTFSAALVTKGLKGADKILPATFLVIVMTVTIYGLTASPVAKWLDVVRKKLARPLIAGGDDWIVSLASTLQKTGIQVLMWASTHEKRESIRARGLQVGEDSLIAEATSPDAEIEGVTEILLLSSEHMFNAVALPILRGGEGGRVYRVCSPEDVWTGGLERDGGSILFHRDLTDAVIVREYNAGARFAVSTSDSPPAGHGLLFRVRSDGELAAVTAAETPEPHDGDSIITFGPITTVPHVLDAGSGMR